MDRNKRIALVFSIAAIFCWFVIFGKSAWLLEVAESLQSAGIWGMLAYGGIFSLASIAIIPAIPLAFGAGYLFGPWIGTAILFPASIIGSSCGFFLGRYLLRDFIREYLANHPKMALVDNIAATQGTKILALILISPLTPFRMITLAVSITKISFWHFFVALLVSMLPHMFPYAYFGSLAKGFLDGSLPGEYLLIGFAATVVLFAGANWIARRAI